MNVRLVRILSVLSARSVTTVLNASSVITNWKVLMDSLEIAQNVLNFVLPVTQLNV